MTSLMPYSHRKQLKKNKAKMGEDSTADVASKLEPKGSKAEPRKKDTKKNKKKKKNRTFPEGLQHQEVSHDLRLIQESSVQHDSQSKRPDTQLFPCLYAQSAGCSRTFSSAKKAKKHSSKRHKDLPTSSHIVTDSMTSQGGNKMSNISSLLETSEDTHHTNGKFAASTSGSIRKRARDEDAAKVMSSPETVKKKRKKKHTKSGVEDSVYSRHHSAHHEHGGPVEDQELLQSLNQEHEKPLAGQEFPENISFANIENQDLHRHSDSHAQHKRAKKQKSKDVRSGNQSTNKAQQPDKAARSHGSDGSDEHDVDSDTMQNFATSVARRTMAMNNVDSEEENVKNVSFVMEPQVFRVLCPRCKRPLKDQDTLRNHMQSSKAHKNLQKCSECEEEFFSIVALADHKALAHPETKDPEQKGQFQPHEIQKLYEWRDQFCSQYSITVNDFNEMMSDTTRRTRPWNHSVMQPRKFLQEYYSVLPERNRRSMQRFRERHFHNIEMKKDWTKADDDELVRLVDEFGPKWAMIADRLTRNTDAVVQRWRNQLQNRKSNLKGEWSQEEQEKFLIVIDEVKKALGLALDVSTDDRIPWTAVGQRMGTRTAQQCSNHFRAIRGFKDRTGRWLKINGLDRVTATVNLGRKARIMRSLIPTAGDSPRKVLSSQYIDDSDDLDDSVETFQSMKTTQRETENLGIDDNDERNFQLQDQAGNTTQHNDRNSSRMLPFNKTPAKTFTSSQAFAQTQADSSGARQPTTFTQRFSSPIEQPSPGIPLQLRPTSPSSSESLQEEQSTDDSMVDDTRAEFVTSGRSAKRKRPPKSKSHHQSQVRRLDEESSQSDNEELSDIEYE